jgi:Mrp family chromosome partitioning ATPase
MTALDQAFIKAYKQLSSAGKSAPAGAGSMPPETTPEASRLETPASTQERRSPKNEAEVLSFVPPPKARQTRSKSSRKNKKQTVRPPEPAETGAADIVYRLDPPCASVPDAPLSGSFRSAPSSERSSESKKRLRMDGAMQDAPPCPATEAPATGFYPESTIRVFQPMLQVDHFAWPKVCRRLESQAPEELDRVADTLHAAGKGGMKIVGFSGSQRGHGATTLLLCAAKRLVSRGVKTVIVDADLREPQLAKCLGLLPQLGWEHVAAGCQPVEEVLVESAADNLTVLPLCQPLVLAEISLASQRIMAGCLNTLRNNYDLVLLDLGPLDNPRSLADLAAGGLNCRIDGVVVIHNAGKVLAVSMPAVRQSLAAAGVTVIGVVENFVQDSPSPEL